MAPVTPTGEPTQVIAGDSARWRIPDHPDYPNSESWALKYELVGVNTLAIVPTFQTSGDDENHWLIEIPTTDTDDLDAGNYELWKRFVGAGSWAGQEVTIGCDGKVNGPPFKIAVRANPRSAPDGLFQTHAERTLDVIEAALEGRLAKDLESYQIAGRSISKIPIETLMKMRGRYAGLVKQERSGRLTRRHLVRFPAHA